MSTKPTRENAKADSAVVQDASGQSSVDAAADALRRGGVIGYPTEGVWGLGCDPFNEAAVHRLLALKQRAVEKGLIVIGADIEAFAPELAELDETARQQVLTTWPAAVSFVLPTRRFPAWVTGGRPAVAARVPDHALCRRLCQAFGGAIVSTSLNPAGEEPALSEAAARRYFPKLDAWLCGETGGRNAPSQLIDPRSEAVLR